MSRSTPTQLAASPPREGARGTVLVVDGDPAVRRVVRLVLEGAGYSCMATDSPTDARFLVSQHRPDLVLADFHGGLSAEVDLQTILDAEGWRPRVALMSAYPRNGRGMEDYFIRKPIEFDRLLQILETIERGAAG